jgi:hypothetical protein
MLPFPDAVEEQKKTENLSKATIAAMKRAIESRKIKPQLLSAMMECNEEIAKFAQSVL